MKINVEARRPDMVAPKIMKSGEGVPLYQLPTKELMQAIIWRRG